MREVTPQGEVRYEYDAANRRTAMELGNGARWEYGYDPAGRLLSVSHPQGAVSYAYDAAGRMTTVNRPNQVIASYSYDAANQITRITYSRAGMEIGDLSYSYDAAGRRISQGGSLARLGASGEDFDATYDAANRLITFNGQPLSYDPNGNLLSGLGQSYVWDARDQLSQTADLSFAYDALGRRTQRSDATATTGYLHDGANPIQVDQTLMLSGLGLDAFAAEITPSGTQTYIRDALGSVLAMVDDTGATTGENRYSAYGQTTTTGEASQFAYTGREKDAADLYYYRARYYSPVLSRFLSEDPIGLRGGSNVYGYVSGDPISFNDPLGLVEWAGTYVSYSLGAQGSGGSYFLFNLTSECVGDYKVNLRLRAAAVGLSLFSLPVGVVGGNISFDDPWDFIDTGALAGPFTFAGSSVNIGIGVSAGVINLGDATTGIDMSLSAGVGWTLMDIMVGRSEIVPESVNRIECICSD
nr:RHS repeat-associated core domain-containing protein [Oceanococcus sp. HetDA_MAG_MS8]